MTLTAAVHSFTGDRRTVLVCTCSHRLHGTGGVFYQSVGLIQCAHCDGWQRIRKPIN